MKPDTRLEALAALGVSEEEADRLSIDLAATHGSISEPGLAIEFYGACPVQGTGFVDGYPCYYRARGGCGSFEVFVKGTDLSELGHGEWPEVVWEAEPFDGDGWDEAAVTKANICAAVAQFREWMRNGGAR